MADKSYSKSDNTWTPPLVVCHLRGNKANAGIANISF